ELAEGSAGMMGRGAEEFDERFTAFVRSRGEHHLRVATLLTGNPDAAEDLVQASLLKLYRAWSRIDTSGEPDAYLRRIIVNTRRSWWRARGRQGTPVPEVAEAAAGGGPAEPAAGGALGRQAAGRAGRAGAALLRGPAGSRGGLPAGLFGRRGEDTRASRAPGTARVAR